MDKLAGLSRNASDAAASTGQSKDEQAGHVLCAKTKNLAVVKELLGRRMSRRRQRALAKRETKIER
jgi:hypothetical protein